MGITPFSFTSLSNNFEASLADLTAYTSPFAISTCLPKYFELEKIEALLLFIYFGLIIALSIQK